MHLRTVRFIWGLTQIELQAASGVFQTRISRFERGHAKPSKKEKALLEALLGPIDWNTPPRKECLPKSERRESRNAKAHF